MLAEYRAQLADAKAEAARIIEEARQPADAAASATRRQRLQTELAEHARAGRRRRRVGQGPGHRRPARRGGRASPSAPPRSSSQRNLDRDTQTQLVEQYIDSVGEPPN